MFNTQQTPQGYTPEQLLLLQQAQQLNQFNALPPQQQNPGNPLAGLSQQQINLLASQNLAQNPNIAANPFLVNQFLNQQQQVQQFQLAQGVHAIGP